MPFVTLAMPFVKPSIHFLRYCHFLRTEVGLELDWSLPPPKESPGPSMTGSKSCFARPGFLLEVSCVRGHVDLANPEILRYSVVL